MLHCRQTPLGVSPSFSCFSSRDSPLHYRGANRVLKSGCCLGGNIRLYLSFITANPSGTESQRTWLEIDHLTYIPSTLTNPHIHFVEANNPQNKRRYDVLVYAPPSKAPAFAVIWYNHQWHECFSEAKTY